MKPWGWSLLPWAVVALATLATLASSRAAAQIIVNGHAVVQTGEEQARIDGELAENVFLPAERLVLQRLSQAGELSRQARYAEAARYLGVILNGPEDYFFQPDKNEPIHRSLKSEARRLIAEMPKKGREFYEIQYGARARRMLTEAISTGDRDRLADVSQQFYHTDAGYEATLLLGLDHLDHGRPLAAALTLQRLRQAMSDSHRFEPTLSLAMATCRLQAGMPQEAQAALAALKQNLGRETVAIAGKQVSLFTRESEALPWLVGLIGPQNTSGEGRADSWAMFRGGPSRNAAGGGGAPLLNVRWQIPLADGPLEEKHLRRLQRSSLERGVATLPGLHPLVVDDVVLMRTMRNLLAVDSVTGKRLWEVPLDELWETVAVRNTGEADAFSRPPVQLAVNLQHRIWDDAAYGTLSSDGRLVFSIEDLDKPMRASAAARTLAVPGRSQTTAKAYNRLTARDVHTGRLKWPPLGGPADEFALRQAETFFLGPPLPLSGQLYVLAEIKGEIRLLALDARSGDLLWSQQLAVVQRGIFADRLRRLAGASPSYCDGILICPTSTGAVVAVELATQSLLWGFRYKRPKFIGQRAAFFAMQMGGYAGSQPPQGWRDATACIADGRVLVSPVEWDSLHCLSLIDGKHLWEYCREDDLYVACVHRDKVVLVGNGSVRAVCLSDTQTVTETVRTIEAAGGRGETVEREVEVTRPKPAWGGRTVSLPRGTMPSGRGFRSGDRYFLPLSSAEVMTIDLVTGKSTHVSKSRKENVPGNLVCYRGKIISQGFDCVEEFYQLDAARQDADRLLAKDPEDPEGLSLRAEILLDEGKRAEAIELLCRAHEQQRHPETPTCSQEHGPGCRLRTRELLRDALLDGLQTRFAAYRGRAEEIEQLIDNSEQRATFLRLMAVGLRQAGDWQEAMDHYLKLIDLDRKCVAGVSDGDRMERVSSSLSVRRDRWIRAQLAVLRSEAAAEAAVIDRVVEAQLQAALERPNIDPLQRFLNYFGDHPAVDEARDELFVRLKNSDRLLEAELLLWPRQRSSDPTVAGEATAELAELLRQAERPDDAAMCYKRLGGEFAEVACRNGKTGKEILDALPEGDPVGQALHRDTDWPVGKVEVELKTVNSIGTSGAIFGGYPLSYHGSRRPFFSETTLHLDKNQHALQGFGALGEQRWKISLLDPGARNATPFYPNQIRVRGHLMLLSTGYKVLAVDTLGRSETGEPASLWSQDLTDPNLELAGLGRLPIQIAVQPWGWQQFQMARYRNVKPSTLGPVTSHYVCFQRYGELVVADPLSGEVFWIRRDVPPESVLFGDEQYVFAVAPTAATVGRGESAVNLAKNEAVVFRALDGKLLGKRKLPASGSEVAAAATGSYALSPDDPPWIGTFGRQILVWRPSYEQCVLEMFDPWEQRVPWPARAFSGQAKYCLVGQEAIGVMEPDGRFLLLSLADGRTIAETQLEPETTLSEIVVLRFATQYVLVTNSPNGGSPATGSPATGSQSMIQPLRGVLHKEIHRGRVYSFGPDGELLWPQPVKIENQHLLLHQPARLPVLAFACQLHHRTERGSLRYGVSVLLIDKRTGRKIYADNLDNLPTTFGMIGHPEENSVVLSLSRRRLTMTFTDEPLPPIEEADEDTPTEVLLKVMRKAIGDALNEPKRPRGETGEARGR